MCYVALDKQVAGRQRCRLLLASNATDYRRPTTLHSAKNLVLDLLWPYGKLSRFMGTAEWDIVVYWWGKGVPLMNTGYLLVSMQTPKSRSRASLGVHVCVCAEYETTYLRSLRL